MNSKFIKQISRPLSGAALLLLILYNLEFSYLITISQQVNWLWIFVGLVSLVTANIFSVFRWSRILRILGFALPLHVAVKLYAQGIAANTVLPGGVIGGDIVRILGLTRRGILKPYAIRSVLIDRISGVWVLSFFSALAAMLALEINSTPPPPLYVPYVIALVGIFFGPLVFYSYRKSDIQLLLRTFLPSLFVQLFALFAFWLCFKSLGHTISALEFVAAGAGVFIAGALPASIGGFGARELGAVIFLTPLGLDAEVSFIASVLYGLLASIQGGLSVFWFVRR